MKKLTADKFDKNNIYRNTIDLISQYANSNHSAGANSNGTSSQKPWKNNGNEEYVDCVNQHTITMNNKLLSENQSFRNILIQLNNDLNNFIKQSKDEYIRKKIKEEGDKDENLKEYYQQKLPDIDLIYFKEDCLNLPYERVGAAVVDIFRENFKVVKLFLASISSLLYSHNYYHELGKELDKIKDNLLKIRGSIDVTKILFTDRSTSLPSYITEGFDNAALSNQQNTGNDPKKLHFEITDFKQGSNQNDIQQYLPSQSPHNPRSQSQNKSHPKGTLAVISNNHNHNSNTPGTPSLSKHQSAGRNTSQNRGLNQASNLNTNDKQKPALNKQSSINNSNQNTNGLNLIKKDQQNLSKGKNQDEGDEKLLNSAKIEQMIKEKLNARLKVPLLPTSQGEINSSNNTKNSSNNNNNNNNSGGSNLNNLNKISNLKDNLLSDRSHLNELESYLQNYQNENFHINYDLDKVNSNNQNHDLSLSFVSRVSFRDVPYGGADFDEKMIEGLGITPRDTIKGAAGDPKQMQLDMKRWQNILSASNSEVSLFNSQNDPQMQSNEQKTQVLLKNMNPGQQSQLQTLNGVDINYKKTTKK